MFKNVCRKFIVAFTPENGDQDYVMFTKEDSIFSYNYETDRTKLIYKFQNELKEHTILFITNTKQTAFFVATSSQALIVNPKMNNEIKIPEHFSMFKAAVYHPSED